MAPEIDPRLSDQHQALHPQADWLNRLPKDARAELEALKGHEKEILAGLQDKRTQNLFLHDPAKALTGLGIPLSPRLLELLRPTKDADKILATRKFRLPDGTTVTPMVHCHFTGDHLSPSPVLRDEPGGGRGGGDQAWPQFKAYGRMTNGYNVVLEMQEGSFERIVQTLLPKSTYSWLMKLLGQEDATNSPFTASLSIGGPDSPNDPAYNDSVGKKNLVDLHIVVNVLISLDLRLVAGVSVIRMVFDGLDAFWVGCKADDIVYAGLTAGPVSLGWEDIQDLITKAGGFIPLIPIPANDNLYKSVDVCIVDDDSKPNGDALALLLMFENGQGDKSKFTQSFVPQGETGAIEVDFMWLMRSLSPEIDALFAFPDGSFNNGQFSGDIIIGNPNDGIHLLKLGVGVIDGDDKLTIRAIIQKSGFCYTATGTGGAAVTMDVSNGVLNVNAQVDTNPAIDVSIPWYCYVGSALLGGILGGIIADVTGALVGNVLLPLLLYTSQDGLTSTINKALTDVVNKINGILPNQGINLPLSVFDVVIQEVHIDDITIYAKVETAESVPLWSNGEMFIPNEGCLDLDDGAVSPPPGPAGADLAWTGLGDNRCLATLGNTKLVVTSTNDLSTMTLYELYQCSFQANQAIPVTQLQQGLPGSHVFGCLTDQGRYSCFQVHAVQDNGIWLRYKTYPTYQAHLEVGGGFSRTLVLLDSGASPVPDDNQQIMFSPTVGRLGNRWGTWKDIRPLAEAVVGNFTVYTKDLYSPSSISWWLGGQPLTETQGQVKVQGINMNYQRQDSCQDLTVTIRPPADMDLEIKATVTDFTQHSATGSITLNTDPPDRSGPSGPSASVIPRLPDYIEAYRIHIGPWQEVQPNYWQSVGYNRKPEVTRPGE